MNICSKCGYEWESRKPNPKCCPMCKSYKWQKESEKPKSHFQSWSETIKQVDLTKNHNDEREIVYDEEYRV